MSVVRRTALTQYSPNLMKTSALAAERQQHNNMPTILELPDEILEKIIAEAAKSNKASEGIKHDKTDPGSMPSTRLRDTLLRLTVCKRVHHLAFDAYFIHNELSATVGDAPRVIPRPRFSYKHHTDAIIKSGSFEEHPVYFQNTRKLKVKIGHVPLDGAIKRIEAIISSCEKLAHLSICLDGLEKEEIAQLREKTPYLVSHGKRRTVIHLIFEDPTLEGMQPDWRPKSTGQASGEKRLRELADAYRAIDSISVTRSKESPRDDRAVNGR